MLYHATVAQERKRRYLLADDSDTLYVSFMGTKQRRDLVTNAAVLQEPLWPDIATEAERKSEVSLTLTIEP